MTDHLANAARLLQEATDTPPEGITIRSVRAGVEATLALVEVTERLAVAQETANLIAYADGLQSAMDRLGVQGGPAAKLVQELADDIRGRIGYPNS